VTKVVWSGVVLLLLYGAALTGCASAGIGGRSPLPFPAPSNPALLTGAFPWAVDRPLTWSDFDGPPDVASPAVALSVYVLTYDVGCDGGVFKARVVSSFLPRVSWVRTAHLLDASADRTLHHEQRHFDLSEVQARRARLALRTLSEPCTRSDDELDALLADFGRRDAEIQRRYDRETAHGTDLGGQARWDRQIEEWLAVLPR
jgi:hypothetical protein